VMWAKQHGIYEHPSWYPCLTNESSFASFQANVHSSGYGNCSEPCEADSTSSQEPQACHTAAEGEECFTAVMWAKQQGIYEHPSWYPGLTHESSFASFQASFHSSCHGNCPQPCETNSTSSQEPQACHTAAEGEECFTAVMWAKQQGVYEQASWYPGLSANSTLEAFQAYLHSVNHGSCPEPCEATLSLELVGLQAMVHFAEQACHSAVLGEECFGHVTWAMQHGIFQHPSGYPGLTNESSFASFQASLHWSGHGNCPQPCETNSTSSQEPQACHAAAEGEECFTAVMWAKQHGIYEHPSWYPCLTNESSFASFQANVHSSGYGNCSEPCEADSTSSQEPQACHTAAEGEECFTAVMWAKQQGIYEHPSWYPGLTHESSFASFQASFHSSCHGNCPQPCETNSTSSQEPQACHTAAEGEECFTAVMWAKQQGVYEQASWYPGLSANSTLEAFQAYLHSVNHGSCPEPCNGARALFP